MKRNQKNTASASSAGKESAVERGKRWLEEEFGIRPERKKQPMTRERVKGIVITLAVIAVMIAVMVALFYFVLYRPQKKQAAKRKALLDSLEIGVEVVTIGGIYGKITALDEKTATLEVAPGTKITFARAAINGKVTKEAEQ